MAVTSVTLGNFFQETVNGISKTVLGGAGGSGLDTQSLLNALVQAKSQPATNDQTQITANGKISTALTSFQSLLSSFQGAAQALSNPPGVGNAANNVFDFTTSSISNGGSAYLSVTAQPGAALQSYNISDISSLATAAQQGTGSFSIASADTAIVSASPISGTNHQFAPGTITFTGGQTITLNAGDTLNTVANDFNAISGATGIGATVIQLGSGQYQLSFAATATGAGGSFNLGNGTTITSDPSGVLSNIGLTQQQTTGVFTIADPAATIVASAAPIPGIGEQFTPGTYTVGSGSVTITEGQTLDQVASDINSAPGINVTAHVIKAGAGQYKLTITANPGVSSFSTTLTGVGLATTAAAAANAGTDANFKINGVSITRATNNISDVVKDLTFNLLGTTADPAAVYTAAISPDTTTIQNAIVAFVNDYNALKTFAAQQTQLNSDGTYASTAVLANNQTFRQIMSDVNTNVTSSVSGLSGVIKNLSDVGITLTNQPATSTTPAVDNTLTINDQQLTSALSGNFRSVKNLFGLNLTANNPNLAVYADTNPLGWNNFTLNIDPVSKTYTAVNPTTGDSIALTATALGTTGYSLAAPQGSALSGLTLIYGASTAATITVSLTQGVADQSYRTANAALIANKGTLAVALTGLQTSDTTLQNDITKVNTQVAQYQQQMLNQFSALEKSIASVNTLLQSLSANQNAALTTSGH